MGPCDICFVIPVFFKSLTPELIYATVLVIFTFKAPSKIDTTAPRDAKTYHNPISSVDNFERIKGNNIILTPTDKMVEPYDVKISFFLLNLL